MKFYGGQSSCANETENDKKYSSIFHDLKFSYYYVYKNFRQLYKFNKKRKEKRIFLIYDYEKCLIFFFEFFT